MREFKSNHDVHKFIEELVDYANKVGDDDVVSRLREAIARGGTSPTEQLDELQLALRQIRVSLSDKYPNETKGNIDKVIRAINQALRRANRFW